MSPAIVVAALLVALAPGLSRSTAEAQPASAASTGGLSQSRRELAATAAGGVAIFAGGWSQSGTPSSTVDIYDGATGQWQTGQLSEARFDPEIVTAGTKVLIAGGQLASGAYSSALDVYDSTTGRWTAAHLSTPWQKGSGTSAAKVVGGKVVFVSKGAVDVYDSATDQVHTVALAQPRDGAAVAQVGSQVVIAGGEVNGQATDQVDVYDASSDQWSVAHLAQARSYMGTAIADQAAVFAGGEQAGQPSSAADVFDSRTNQWSASTLPVAGGSVRGPVPTLSAVSVGGKAVFVGSDNRLAVYGSTSGGWTAIDLSPKVKQDLPGNLSVVTAGGQLALSNPYATDIAIVDPASGGVTLSAIPGDRRYWGTLTAVGSSVVLAGGGFGGTCCAFPSDLATVYDLATGSWSTSSLALSSYGPPAAVVGNSVFYTGNPSSLDRYDADAHQWTQVPLSTPRDAPAIAGVNGSLVFAGGYTQAFQTGPSDAVDVYDSGPRTGATWLSQGFAS